MRIPSRGLARELQLLCSSHPKYAGGMTVAIPRIAMKAFREYSRLFVVYMSFAVFLAGEAAVIFLVYKHLGIL